MKKFMLIYNMPEGAINTENPKSNEEREESMQEWYKWRDAMGDSLIDFGSPLVNVVRMDPNGSSAVSKSTVAGYSIMQAKDLAEAVFMLESHPHLHWNPACSIEVHEFGEM